MSDPQKVDEPIWRQRWFQALLALLLVAAAAVLIVPPLLALLYAVRSVLLPVLVGLALAYTVNPLARWLHQRWRVPRTVTAVGVMAAVAGIVLGLLLYLVPKMLEQAGVLIFNVPRYVRELAEHFEVDLEELISRIEGRASELLAADDGNVDVAAVGAMVWQWLDVGLGVIGTTIGMASYLVIAAVVVCFCFFFFLWKFDAIVSWFVPFVPATHRERTLDIVRQMDWSVSAFIRGRLIQAIVVAVVLSVGWWLAGVPYWLLLGVGSGLLNLIPYAAVVGWPIAVGLAWLDSLTGGAAAEATTAVNGAIAEGDAVFDLWSVLVWPSAVYLLAQGLDGWVIEPLVQGQATNLDPLTVLLAVLLGGSLMGLLGLMIAIPLAACLKILAKEVVLPQLRTWAAAT
ncbi:MAG: AI-2E family transporter [Phycisphaeraceae bacterium]